MVWDIDCRHQMQIVSRIQHDLFWRFYPSKELPLPMLSESLWLWVHKNPGLASGWLREPRVRNSAFPSSINKTPKNLLGSSALPTILTYRYCHRLQFQWNEVFFGMRTLVRSATKGGKWHLSRPWTRGLPVGSSFMTSGHLAHTHSCLLAECIATDSEGSCVKHEMNLRWTRLSFSERRIMLE